MSDPTIKNTRDVATNGIKVVVYGRPKIGKTRLAATAPNPIIISTEKGMLSLRRENLPYIDVENLEQLWNAYTWLNSPRSQRFNTVAFDSISDLAEIVVGSEKKKNKDGRKAYGNANDIVMDVFRDFRNIPNKNIYFIAKEQENVGANGFGFVQPIMPDKYLTMQLPYMFDCILHYTWLRWSDGNSYPALHTKADLTTFAGDRSGTLDEWEQPNLAHIFNKIAKG